MPFVTVKPYSWPQDLLEIPNGFGGMPPIEFGNAHVVGQTWFSLAADFTFTEGTPAYTQRLAILPTPQDGDFWCDSIGVVSWQEDTESEEENPKNLQHFITSVVSISDIRTGRNLIYGKAIKPFNSPGGAVIPDNSIPINFFRKLPQSGQESSGNYAGDTPTPNGFRCTQSLIQPVCFTRQGGINVTVTTIDAVPDGSTFFVTLGFNGWKEYINASV